MNKKVKYQTIIISLCLLFSIFIVGTHRINKTKPTTRFSYDLNLQSFSYFLNEKIPTIVDGNAKIFDTKTYFEKNKIDTYYAKAHVVSNNISNLKLSIGYKSMDFDLLEVPDVIDGVTSKEITLWERQNNYPASSNNLSSITRNTASKYEEINFLWNLVSIGFNSDEYVKADERIWYLRINHLDNNSKCEYVEQTVTEDGETFTNNGEPSNKRILYGKNKN